MSETRPAGNADGAADGAALRLDLPAAPEALDDVHDQLDLVWERHDDVSVADRFRFLTAVMEILGNVAEHAYRPDVRAPQRRLELVVTITADELVATISDNGVPVSLDLSTVTMPDDDAESGRGLALALAALDDLDYERSEDRNRWRLQCVRRD